MQDNQQVVAEALEPVEFQEGEVIFRQVGGSATMCCFCLSPKTTRLMRFASHSDDPWSDVPLQLPLHA